MTDRFVVRTVVLGLLAIVIASIVACVVLAMNGTDLPEFLKYVGTTAIGAFAGVLAKTNTEPQPVVVQNEPVAVDQVDPAAVAAPRKGRGRRRTTDAGHADILLALAVAVGVFFGYVIAYAVVHAVR